MPKSCCLWFKKVGLITASGSSRSERSAACVTKISIISLQNAFMVLYLHLWIKISGNMVSRDTLMNLKSGASARAAYNEVKQDGGFVEFATLYMHDSDDIVARHSLWVLTQASDRELKSIQPLMEELTCLAMSTPDSSIRRLSLNLIERLRMEPSEIRGDFFDFCIEHFVQVDECSGIQAVCGKLAFRMAGFYPELMGELRRTLESVELEYYKPAFKCIRTKILKGTL